MSQHQEMVYKLLSRVRPSEREHAIRLPLLSEQCTNRLKLLDKSKCGGEVWSCSKHQICSHQKQHCSDDGIKFCGNCTDWNGTDYIEMVPATGKCGIVIGSFGMPGVVELNIAAIRKTCGEIPILVCDDLTPVSMGQKRILNLPERCKVSLIINNENHGHAPGDIRAFRNGLQWAKRNGIKYLCKLSQRFIFTRDNWLQDWCDEMKKDNAAVSSQRAVHLHMQFALRSECVFMDVEKCTSSHVFMDRLDPENGKIPTSAEDWLAAAINEGGLGPVLRCRLMTVDRFSKRDGVIWHNTDGCDNYFDDQGESYRALARELNVDLGPEFSAAGWHVIAPHRPDAKYHML